MNRNLVVYLGYAISLFLGLTIRKIVEDECTCDGNVKSLSTKQNILSATRRLRTLEESAGNDSFFKLSENQFSCNAQKAFEKLTLLHFRANNLAEHNKRGDANKARTETVLRKFGQASSAEASFRICLSSIMPELLSKWDNELAHGKINVKAWSEDNEINIEGITFETLERTADALEKAGDI